MTELGHPPRRASVEDIETGRLSWDEAQRLTIQLDGEVQKYVVAYDCDAGTVTRHVNDRDGRPMVDEQREEVKTETVKGIVTSHWDRPA